MQVSERELFLNIRTSEDINNGGVIDIRVVNEHE